MLPPKSPPTPLFQRGEFLPFVKGGKEGFCPRCLYNYSLINKKETGMYELSGLLSELYPAIDLLEAVPELNPMDSGEYWTLDCPYCGQHEVYAFKKNIGYIVCRGSAESGRAFTLFRYYTEVKNLSTGEAIRMLADLAHYPLDLKPKDFELYEEEQRKMTLLEEAESLFVAQLWSNEGGPVMKNLTETRKYTENEIKGMRLGLFPSMERLREHLQKRGYTDTDERDLRFTLRGLGETHTLTIPYRDPIGNLKGFAVMSVDPSLKGGNTYLWTASRDTLFNLHEAKGGGTVIVVKHPLDALIASRRGNMEIVATGGDRLTGPLIDGAIRHGVNGFILCHDLDNPDREDTLRAIDIIRRDQKGVVFVMEVPQEYGDLDGYLRQHAMEDLVSLAKEACQKNYGVQWKTNKILDKYSDEKYGEQGVYRALDEIKAFQAGLTDPLDRELVVDTVSGRTDANRTSLEESMDSYRSIRAREDLRRGLRELSRDILRKQKKDPETALVAASRQIKGLKVRHERAAVKPAQPLVEFFRRQFELEMERTPEGPLGYKMKKFPGITKNLDGIQPGFYVIGGCPDAGKTALMTNLLLDLLSNNPETRAIYSSFDENRELIRSRLMSIWTEIPRNKVRKGHDSSLIYAKKKQAHNDLMSFVVSRRLDIKDLSEISDMDELELEIRQKAGDDFLVFIDGLNNLPAGELNLDQAERFKKMKQWADTYRVPVFCTANLKKPEGKTKRSTLPDAQEIGDYGFPASAVLLLSENQQEKKARGEDEPVSIVLKFEKNKLSPFRGTIRLSFTPETGVIAEADEK
jgi:DNA primase